MIPLPRHHKLIHPSRYLGNFSRGQEEGRKYSPRLGTFPQSSSSITHSSILHSKFASAPEQFSSRPFPARQARVPRAAKSGRDWIWTGLRRWRLFWCAGPMERGGWDGQAGRGMRQGHCKLGSAKYFHMLIERDDPGFAYSVYQIRGGRYAQPFAGGESAGDGDERLGKKWEETCLRGSIDGMAERWCSSFEGIQNSTMGDKGRGRKSKLVSHPQLGGM